MCVLKKSPLGFNDVWMWDSVCFLVSPPRRTGFFLFLFLDCCLSADCQAKSNEHRATSYPTCTESQLSQHLYGKKLIEFRLVFVLEHQKTKTSIRHLRASRTTQKSAGLQTTNHTEELQVLYLLCVFHFTSKQESADEATVNILSIYEHA